MKALINFVVLSCIIFTANLKAQDSLVTLEGKLLTGKIIEFSADFTSYAIDTTGNEVAMIPSQQFILIKQGEKVIKSYKNDTLITKEGLIIPCKIVAIDPDIVSFFHYNYRVNNIQSIMKGNILMVKFSDGTTERFDQVIKSPLSTSSYDLGMQDAKNYYKPDGGMIVGEVLLGLT
ncbi:MAG: hypothetical protein RL432_2343, partial [Bacteroidota bacterium]